MEKTQLPKPDINGLQKLKFKNDDLCHINDCAIQIVGYVTRIFFNVLRTESLIWKQTDFYD